MGDEKDAFYVVRKGDVIGVYKNLSDLQALLRTSVCFPLPSKVDTYLLLGQRQLLL